MRTALLLDGVLGQGLELTSHSSPKNGFVGVWWHLIAGLLSSPRFIHDPSTQEAPFQTAAVWLSTVQGPSLFCGSTHSSHDPLLLEELPFRCKRIERPQAGIWGDWGNCHHPLPLCPHLSQQASKKILVPPGASIVDLLHHCVHQPIHSPRLPRACGSHRRSTEWFVHGEAGPAVPR